MLKERIVIFFENQRQLDDFEKNEASYQRYNREFIKKFRFKSGWFHYIMCVYLCILRKSIMLVMPRQKLLAYFFIHFTKCYFLEDGLNSLMVSDFHKGQIKSRWFGFRMPILDFDAKINSKIKQKLRNDFGFQKGQKKLTHTSRQTENHSKLVLILNRKSPEQIIRTWEKLEFDIDEFDEVLIFPHPCTGTNQKAILVEHINGIKRLKDINITICKKDVLLQHITDIKLCISARSALGFDFWQSLTAHEKKKMYSKFIGTLS